MNTVVINTPGLHVEFTMLQMYLMAFSLYAVGFMCFIRWWPVGFARLEPNAEWTRGMALLGLWLALIWPFSAPVLVFTVVLERSWHLLNWTLSWLLSCFGLTTMMARWHQQATDRRNHDDV